MNNYTKMPKIIKLFENFVVVVVWVDSCSILAILLLTNNVLNKL